MRHHRWPVAYKFSSHFKFDKFSLLSSKFQHNYGMFTKVNSWDTLADRCLCYIFALFSQPIFKYCSASIQSYIYRCPELSPKMSWHNTLIVRLIAYLFIARLNHWGRMTHICVSKLTIIVSDDGFSPGRRQTIIRTNAGMLSIGPLEKKSVKNQSKCIHSHPKKCIWKCRQEIGGRLSRPHCVSMGSAFSLLGCSFHGMMWLAAVDE